LPEEENPVERDYGAWEGVTVGLRDEPSGINRQINAGEGA